MVCRTSPWSCKVLIDIFLRIAQKKLFHHRSVHQLLIASLRGYHWHYSTVRTGGRLGLLFAGHVCHFTVIWLPCATCHITSSDLERIRHILQSVADDQVTCRKWIAMVLPFYKDALSYLWEINSSVYPIFITLIACVYVLAHRRPCGLVVTFLVSLDALRVASMLDACRT